MLSVKEFVQQHREETMSLNRRDPFGHYAELLQLASAYHVGDTAGLKDDLTVVFSADYLDKQKMHEWFHTLFNGPLLGHRDWRAQTLLEMHHEIFQNCNYRPTNYIFS